MTVCWVILRGQLIYTVIQAVHSLLYIVAKCNFFSVVTWKDIRYLQKCEGCTHFCEIVYIYIYSLWTYLQRKFSILSQFLVRKKGTKNNLWNVVETPDLTSIYRQQVTHHYKWKKTSLKKWYWKVYMHMLFWCRAEWGKHTHSLPTNIKQMYKVIFYIPNGLRELH